MTYANGYAPETTLAHVDGMHVAPGLGKRLSAFFQWAAEQGVELHIARPYGGYCTIPEQWGRYNGGKPTGGSQVNVAHPGQSTHGEFDLGRVDIVGRGNVYSPELLAWVIVNARQFGLVQEFPKGDPRGYDPNHFVQAGNFAGLPAKPTVKIPPEDDTMQIMLLDNDGRYGVKGRRLTALTGCKWSPIELTNDTVNNTGQRISQALGRAAMNCTYAEWEYFKSIAPA